LDGFLARVAQSGSALLLVGDAGIGKKALLDETVRRAEGRGIVVMRSAAQRSIGGRTRTMRRASTV
jgi:predicted ATP-dependent serine protease